jgi:hypothetical protein
MSNDDIKQKLFSPQLASCCSSCATSYLFYNSAADASYDICKKEKA